MIDRDHDLSVTKQAKLLEISRGSVYYCALRGMATGVSG